MWHVSITMAMFWNNATHFYHFGHVLKQCNTFLSLCRCFEAMRRVSITLAMFWNNATRFYHFGDVLKQCDVFLLLWRCFKTMWCVYPFSNVLKQCDVFLSLLAMCFYHFGDPLKQCDVFLHLVMFWNNMTCFYHLAMFWIFLKLALPILHLLCPPWISYVHKHIDVCGKGDFFTTPFLKV